MTHPYIQTWSLNIQKALPAAMVLDVGYQGSRAVHGLMSRSNYNQSRTLPDTSDRFPGFTTISAQTGDGNIRFDSLQVKLRKDLTHGLFYTVNYTWAKNMDDGAQNRSGG